MKVCSVQSVKQKPAHVNNPIEHAGTGQDLFFLLPEDANGSQPNVTTEPNNDGNNAAYCLRQAGQP